MERGRERSIIGLGGAALVVSLFLPWGEGRSGAVDVLLVLAAAVALTAAVTGGRFGLLRPDMSLNAAADLLGVVSSLAVGWLVLTESPGAGAYAALAAAVTVACGAGDYSVFRAGDRTTAARAAPR